MLKSLIKTKAEKVTYVGGAVNFVLSVIKIIGGVLFHSAGLIADGIHSLSDLLSDVMVVVVLRISGKKADKDHPWGHGRFETLGTAILGAALIYLGGIIAYNSFIGIFSSETITPPTWQALIAILLSIIAKEWLYHYTLKVGKEIKSDLIIANAWHHRSDSLSSLAVLVGVIGALFGYYWLDYVAAIVVAIVILKIGFSLAFKSFKQLVDTALEPSEVENLTQIAKSVDGVISVHDFKTRGTGSRTILEMHIQVNPFISSSEGHQIGEKVVMKLEKRAKEIDIAHVIYHIDTYDDTKEKHSDYANLPLRSEIGPIISECLNGINNEIQPFRITLHYHNKKVGVEIMFNQSDLLKLTHLPINQLSKRIESDLLKNIPLNDWLHKVKITSLLDT